MPVAAKVLDQLTRLNNTEHTHTHTHTHTLMLPCWVY